MCKKVRTLLRVSSRQQLHDDDIPIQRAEAMQYIAQRPEWIFDQEYIEKAVSAYKNTVEQREVLQKILADARNRQFDILLTYMSDRIGRQEEYSFYVAALNQLGIEVWTIKDGQLKTQEHIDKLLNYIRFWQNEGESKKTGMRVKDTQKELVKSGKFVGGRAPYGYQLVPSGMISSHGRLLKKLEIIEEKAEVVRKIYHLAIHCGMGYEKIAKELNSQGIPSITTDKWKSGTIRSILTNPIYMGYLALNRRVHQGGYIHLDRKNWIYSDKQLPELVIVPPQTWEAAQKIREARKAKINASKEKASKEYELQHHIPFSTSGRLALTGLAYCGYCGKRLKNGSYCNHWTTKTGESRTSYAGRYLCPSKCPQRSCYSQTYLESIVFETVERFLEDLKPINLTEEWQKIKQNQTAKTEKERKELQKKLQLLNNDIHTLEEKIPDAIRENYYFSAEKLASIIKEKETERQKLSQKACLLKSQLLLASKQYRQAEKSFSLTPDWKKEFHNADTKIKKMLLSSLLDKVTVTDNQVCIQFKIRPEDFT